MGYWTKHSYYVTLEIRTQSIVATLPKIQAKPSRLNEPQRQKTYLLTCAPNEDSDHPAHPRSLISLRFQHEATLNRWLSKIRKVKILIRLRECAG